MKYIVITSKHHDGFALYDSKVSTFDVVDATPFKRDILKELAAACQKRGMPLGWLARMADHIPDPGKHRTHFYGYYANRSRGDRSPEVPADGKVEEAPAKKRRRSAT